MGTRQNMTMRTPAAEQPRILSKKIIFHLHINGGTQERIVNFVKIFFVYVYVKKIIPHLCKRKIAPLWRNELARVFLC